MNVYDSLRFDSEKNHDTNARPGRHVCDMRFSMLRVFLNGDIGIDVVKLHVDEMYEVMENALSEKQGLLYLEVSETVCLVVEMLHAQIIRNSEHSDRARSVIPYFLAKGIPSMRSILQIPADDESLYSSMTEQLVLFD